MFRSSSIHSLLTGIFRESLSDFRRNQFLSCAVFKVRARTQFAQLGIRNEELGIWFAQALSSSFFPEVSCEPSKRYRQEIIDPFQSRLFSVRLSAPLSLCQLYQSVLRRLFRFACRFHCFMSHQARPRNHSIPNSSFLIPHSTALDLRIRTKLSASYIAP